VDGDARDVHDAGDALLCDEGVSLESLRHRSRTAKGESQNTSSSIAGFVRHGPTFDSSDNCNAIISMCRVVDILLWAR
jgi:hypothetical protein